MRASAFTIYPFLRLGFSEETEQFMRFLASLCKEPGPGGSLQVMYGIDGRKHLIEETLDHLDGYMGSRPVRIGNGAYNQLQLDIYGALSRRRLSLQQIRGADLLRPLELPQSGAR